MMSDRVLGDHEIQQFIEEGYVCVKQAIDPETVTKGLAGLKAKTGIVPDDSSTWPKGERYINMNKRWESDPLHTKLKSMDHTICVTPRLVNAARELAGADVVLQRMSPAMSLPEPGPRVHDPRGMHIDKVVMGITMYPEVTHLTALGYLTDTLEYGGALTVFPGSHRKVFEYALGLSEEIADDIRSNGIPDIDYGNPVAATGEAGDVILFHHLMIHSASANRGDWVRVGVRGEVRLPTDLEYEPRLGPPQEDWLPIDWTLRTDNLEKDSEPA